MLRHVSPEETTEVPPRKITNSVYVLVSSMGNRFISVYSTYTAAFAAKTAKDHIFKEELIGGSVLVDVDVLNKDRRLAESSNFDSELDRAESRKAEIAAIRKAEKN